VHYLTTRSYEWVVEGDIEACFDRIDHTALLDRVRGRIEDKRVLRLVKAFLHAGILTEHGGFERSVTGTSQGGILTAPTQLRTSSSSGRLVGRREGVSRDV
jgi:RNA-directed DNA polymerase